MSKWRMYNDSDIDVTFDFNPSRDTGFSVDPIFTEQHPIGGRNTVLQIGGTKSRFREAEGLIKDPDVKDAIQQLHENREVFRLVDHNGMNRQVFMIQLRWDTLMDASNPDTNYQSYKYTMRLIRRPTTG